MGNVPTEEILAVSPAFTGGLAGAATGSEGAGSARSLEFREMARGRSATRFRDVPTARVVVR